MEALDVSRFVGLDLRRLPEATSPRALLEAKNVHVSRGAGYAARGAFARFASVDSTSKGLYVVNDEMRCALPYPSGTPVPRPPVNIRYDVLTDSSSGFQGTLDGLGDHTNWETRAYLSARVPAPSGGFRYRHYYIPASQTVFSGFATNQAGNDVDVVGANALVQIGSTFWLFGVPGAFLVTNRVGDTFTLSPALPTLAATVPVVVWSPVTNRVSLPFEPGAALETVERKIYAPDLIEKVVWFSSTLNGPTDWMLLNDAGFLRTTQYPGGDQANTALAVFNRQLVIFYADNIQVWSVDPDPQEHYFFAQVGGVGTRQAKSVANILGDLMFFSEGGYASLAAVITTGQPKAGNVVGEPIAKLTQAVDADLVGASVWSPARQQYLGVFGDEVFVYTFAPGDQDMSAVGWGRWETPWPVSDIVEWRGDIYVRRADAPEVWKLMPDGETSTTEVVQWSWAGGFASFNQEGHSKAIRFFDPNARGFFNLMVQTDPNGVDAPIDLGTVDLGSGLGGIGKMAVVLTADYLQLQASGENAMFIDGFTWRYRMGRLM